MVKRSKWALLLICLFSYIWFCVYIYSENKKDNRGITENLIANNDKERIPIGQIWSDIKLTQRFTANYSDLCGVSIQFATYARDITCTISVSITEEDTGKLIAYEVISGIKKEKDNQFYTIEFSNQKKSFGKRYLIKIKTVGVSDGNAPAIWASDGKRFNNKEGHDIINDYLGIKTEDLYDTALFYNDTVIKNTLNIQVDYFKNRYASTWKLVTLGIILLSFVVLGGMMKSLDSRVVIIAVYLFFSIFTVYKGGFYINNFRAWPDESKHIAYIGYLDQNNTLIPEFKDMGGFNVVARLNRELSVLKNTSNFNYLGHPPLYYHLFRLTGAVKYYNGYMLYNEKAAHTSALLFHLLIVIFLFYIGFTRIKRHPLLHLCYALMITSVPMYTYIGMAVNNDNLSYLAAVLFLIGGLRFSEEKKNYKTYMLIAAGIVIGCLSKLTTGMMLLIAIMVYLILKYREDKSNISIVINKRFYTTIPVYLLAVSYFMYIYMKYKTFQPSMQTLFPEQFIKSGFFVPPERRGEVMSVVEYIRNFFVGAFLPQWTGIMSHKSLIKHIPPRISVEHIGALLILFGPALMRVKDKYYTYLTSSYIGLIVTVIYHIHHNYSNYLSTGYRGGHQSRYYLFAIPILAFTIIKFLENRINNENKEVCAMWSVFIILFSSSLFYSDFVYLLLNFR